MEFRRSFRSRLLVAIAMLLSMRMRAEAEAKEPTVEFRGLFLTSAGNTDWPISRNDSVQKQQSDLLGYLDMMNQTNMNAVVFQIRPAGDALYDSPIEPWSKYLTGTQGKPPSPLWDPLAFAVKYGHQRNIEIHAWLNPYLANTSPNWNGLAPNHVANKFREYAYPYSSYLWMDPAADVVAGQIIKVVTDIMTRYDVDGILFDDFFYPYPDGTPFPDNKTYNKYIASGGKLSRDDWRRDNVNRLIARVHSVVKSIKPSGKFGISPFGLYRPGKPEGMPPPIKGFDPYSETYADSKLWLQKGLVDYLSPQLYWAIDPVGQSYPVVLDWWLKQNTAGKHIYVSNGVYRIVQSKWPVSEITNQVAISRDSKRRERLSLGNIHFSAVYFRKNTKNITDIFKSSVYTRRATVPTIP